MTHKPIILRENSHSLSLYQGCSEKYKLNIIEWLGSNKFHAPFVKGDLVHKVLGAYDLAKFKEGNIQDTGNNPCQSLPS